MSINIQSPATECYVSISDVSQVSRKWADSWVAPAQRCGPIQWPDSGESGCCIPGGAQSLRLRLEERALAQGKVTKKELEEARRSDEWAYKIMEHGKLSFEELQGLKPDSDGFFLEWDSRWAREQKRKAKEAKP